MRGVTVDDAIDDRADAVLLDELNERKNLVHRSARGCRSGLFRRQRGTRGRSLGHRHRLHRRGADLRLGSGFLLSTLFGVSNRAAAFVPSHRCAIHEHPADVRNRLAADQTALVEQPRILTMELLVAVVRKNGSTDLLSNAQDEAIASTDGSRRRCDQLVVLDRLVERLGLLGVDAMAEGGIHDDRDDVLGMIGHEGHHCFVQLLQAGLRTTLGGDVRTVDDDMSGHPASQPPIGFATGDSPTIEM